MPCQTPLPPPWDSTHLFLLLVLVHLPEHIERFGLHVDPEQLGHLDVLAIAQVNPLLGMVCPELLADDLHLHLVLQQKCWVEQAGVVPAGGSVVSAAA